MSRNTMYQDERLIVVHGNDHIMGLFYQIYDNDLINETSEGEGIVMDWSSNYGFQTNLTGLSNANGVIGIIEEYIKDNANGDNKIIINKNKCTGVADAMASAFSYMLNNTKL